MVTALASFVVNSCVLWKMQLRKITPICALLQRMGIFAAKREKFFEIPRRKQAPGAVEAVLNA
jgi:hypothetical protein